MAQLPTRYLVRCFCSSSLEKQKMVEKWCDAFLQDVESFTDKTTIHQNLFHFDWNVLVNSPLWLIKHERNMPKKNGFNITELFSTPKKHIESNIIKPFFGCSKFRIFESWGWVKTVKTSDIYHINYQGTHSQWTAGVAAWRGLAAAARSDGQLHLRSLRNLVRPKSDESPSQHGSFNTKSRSNESN